MRTLVPFWTNRNFISPSTSLWREMDRVFNDMLTAEAPAYSERSYLPTAHLKEDEGHFLLSVEMPGLKKEDIKIEVHENTLSVFGERKRENFSSTYSRSMTLPTNVDADKIEANYQDGILELYLPKVQAAPVKKIEIQSGKEGFFGRLLNANKETSKT